jgi:hypothetical protein
MNTNDLLTFEPLGEGLLRVTMGIASIRREERPTSEFWEAVHRGLQEALSSRAERDALKEKLAQAQAQRDNFDLDAARLAGELAQAQAEVKRWRNRALNPTPPCGDWKLKPATAEPREDAQNA